MSARQIPYPLYGNWPIVPSADLTNLVSQANIAGSGRVGDLGIGKKAGMEIAVANGANDYNIYTAFGSKTSDRWSQLTGTTSIVPVNVLTPGGGGSFTLTTATYAAGVLTSATAAAINATQTVALKKGTYQVRGTVGRRLSTVWPTLTLTEVTGTVVRLAKAYNTATVDATSATVDVLLETFIVSADGNVKIDLNVKDVSGNQTGATFISFVFEGVNDLS